MIAERVNAERLVLLGWSRAILMQMAHPLIAAGVADHSHFRATPVAAVTRLHGTVRAMLALTFGDPIAHGHAIAGIRAIHARVRGDLREATGVFPAGTPYSADDPALLLWVHATLIESVLVVFDRLIAPLSDEDRNEYCRQAAPVAISLGAREEDLPMTWPAVQRYLTDEYSSGRIAVGSDARQIVEAVLFPPLVAISGPFAWVNRLVTLGLLPAYVRDQYGFTWTDRRDRQFQRACRMIRATRRVLPRLVAWWPEARSSDKTTRATSSPS